MVWRLTRIQMLPGVAVAAAGLVACSSGAPSGTPEPQPISAPLPGDNYAFVYHEGSTLGRHDTRTGADQHLASDASEVLAAAASPTGARVAVAYRSGDSSRVLVVDTESGSVMEVQAGDARTTYTMAWSLDGIRLGLGYRPQSGRGGITVVETDGSVRDMGCQASNQFEAWRSASQAVVQDGGAYYTVDASNCATLATLRKVGKTGMEYAPNGGRVAFYQDRTVTFTNRAEPQSIPELWIADYAGNGAKVVADFQSRARNSAWSPTADEITYEVVSRRWANTTHLVTYDVRTADYRYIAEEKALGVPNDFGACWSTGGRRFAHDRTYARNTGTQPYTTRQVVVRQGTDETVVFDEVVDIPASRYTAAKPASCQWIGDRHLLISSRRGQSVVDVEDGETHRFPSDRKVFGVKVFDAERPPGPPA